MKAWKLAISKTKAWSQTGSTDEDLDMKKSMNEKFIIQMI